MQISIILYIERHFKINLKDHRLPQVALVSVHLPTRETEDRWVRSLGGEDTLEEGMATHSSILAWRIPWSLVGYSL